MFTISLFRVHDTVRIRENGESLTLKVDADPMRLTAGLNEARKRLQGINEESDDVEQLAAAMYFAQTVFGEEQAAKLAELYNNDPTAIVNIVGQYFSQRLSKLIKKAQIRHK